jgi:hypothetical protein
MTRMRIALLGVILAIIVGAGFYARAQAPTPEPLGTVISGNDIGFRIERTEPNRVQGRLVVRVGGKWVDAQFSPGRSIVPLHTE